MRQSHTAVITRNEVLHGSFALEPYEAAWAGEAIYFMRALEVHGNPAGSTAAVQISPDGMNWVSEGTRLSLPPRPGMTFCRVTHFGGWLRLTGTLPEDVRLKVIIYLTLKS